MADPNELLRRLEGPTTGQARDAQNALRMLEKLETLGELRPAEAETLAELRASQGATDRAVGQTDALYRGAVQGMTFNFADELGVQDPAALARSELQYPGEFRTGRAAGGLATGVGLAAATAPLAPAGIAGNMLLGGAFGAVEGAAWEAGKAQPGERASAAGRGALYGGGLGAAAPLAVGVGAKAIGAGDDLVRGMFNRGNEGRANRSAMSLVRKSGQTPDQLADDVQRARIQGQPEYRLMDALGTPGQRKASGIVRQDGPGADELSEFLETRQMNQGDRVGAFVEDAFETRGTTARQTQEALTDRRGRTADAMYDAARANAEPVDVRPAVNIIDRRIGGMQGSNVRGDGIDARLSGFRDRLTARSAPDGELSRELSDFDRVLGVKQDVQDAIGAAVRAGRNNEARELGKLATALDQQLERASDAYRFANDNFREASRVIDSVETGSTMARRGRAADNVQTVRGMTDDQRRAARVGYGDTVQDRLERNASPTANKAKPLTSEKARAESDALAVDPQLLRERLDREMRMWATQNRALGGSRTADNLADIEGTGAMADAARAGTDLAAGNTGTAVSRFSDRAITFVTGENEATRKLVADILMSPEPRKALSAALAGVRSAQKKRWIAQAVTRGLGRAAVPDQDR